MPDPGDDFVVRRADGVWSYQLAVVVDDAEMAITEVVRGDDLLPSTPRQVALYRALGREPPDFLHVPLVLGAGGARLSKRDGAAAIGELRRHHSPDEVVGMLAASLGLPPSPASPTDLLPAFDPAHIPAEPHCFSKE
jgi:glutamyl-tRNA synthetase